MLETRQLLAGDLVGHWIAEELNDDLDDGGFITTWTDLTNGIVANVNAGTPQLIKTAHDGHSVIRFDPHDESGNDSFRVTAADSPMSGIENFSIAVVFVTPTAGQGGSRAWFSNSGLVDATGFFGTTADWGLVFNSNGQVGAGVGGPAAAVYSSETGLNDGAIHVAIYTLGGNAASLYIDGGAPDTVSNGVTQARDIVDMTFGTLRSGAFPYTGDIAEIRFYNDSFSTQEVSDVTVELQEFYTNVPPSSVDDDYSVDEDAPLVVSATEGVLENDFDIEGDSFAAVLVHEGSHGTVELAPDGSFTYQPDPNFFGTDSFGYLIRDLEDDSFVATVTIEVLPLHDPAVAVPDVYQVGANDLLTISAGDGVLANDVNLDQIELTAVLVDDVADGDLSLADDGSFTYDPGAFTGTTSFTYFVQDSQGEQNTTTVTLLIDSIPVAIDDEYDVTEDDSLDVTAELGVLANDEDAESDPLTASLVTPPAHGAFSFLADGSFHYVPDRNYSGGDQFTYRASDGDQQSPLATVTLNVLATNDLPIGRDDRYFGLPHQTLTVAAGEGVLINDRDLDSPTLQSAVVSPPDHGTLVLATDGSFTYDPDADFQGTDRFTYRVNDTQDDSEPVTVALSINPDRIVISEILASNDGQLSDYYDDSEDWFEILNQDTKSVDLEGWYVTDDPADLTKWQIPVATELAPGEREILFASGRDTVTPTGERHTNFRLVREGDYLALVGPDGTSIVWDVDPSFPPQMTNVSYGLATLTETSKLVAARDSVQIFLPEDGSLGQSWTEANFDDSAWDTRTTGVGFAVEPAVRLSPGFTTRMVEVEGGEDGQINDLDEAEAILDGNFAPEQYRFSADVTIVSPRINLGGRGGAFGSNDPYPDGTVDGQLSDVAVRATASVFIPEGDWTIAVGANDAALLRLDGVRFINTFGEAEGNNGDGEIRTLQRTNHSQASGTFSVGSGGLTTTVEAIFFERDGEDSFEIAIIGAHADARVSADTWTLLADGALGWEVTTFGASPLPVFAHLVNSDLEAQMHGRATSAYLRAPFEVEDASAFDELTLLMHYDDAFVAYLNGVEVARGNVSDTPAWNSVADSNRPDEQALNVELIDLTEHLGLLNTGHNVLAIHGMNFRDISTGFLLIPELEAVDELPVRDVGFLGIPTPGEENGTGGVGVLPLPTFSLPGGTFTGFIDLELNSDVPGASVHYTLDGTRPNRLSPVSTGPIEISSTTQVRARAILSDYVRSAINTESYFRLDNSVRDFTSDLPILVVDMFGNQPNGGPFQPSFSALFETREDGRSALANQPEVTSRSGLRIRGSSSIGFAKSPFALEFWQDDSDEDRAISLLGLPAEADWVLQSFYQFDRSFTRNPFIYELSNQVDRQASRTRYVELFVDRNGDDLSFGDYFGVYPLIEKIERNPGRVNVQEISPQFADEPEITGGYILKIDRADPGDSGFNVGNLAQPSTVVGQVVGNTFAGDSADLLPNDDFYNGRLLQFTSGSLGVAPSTVVAAPVDNTFAGTGNLSDEDDVYVDRLITFTSGELVDKRRRIVDYDGATHTFTFEPEADLVGVAAGDQFELERQQVRIDNYDGATRTFTLDPNFDLSRVREGDAFEIANAVPGANFKLVEPKEEDVESQPAQLEWLSNYLNEFLAALYAPEFTHSELGHYGDYIDIDSFVDHHVLNEITLNVDALRLSAYFHKERGEKLNAGPVWDFDRSMESTDGRDDSPTTWYMDIGGVPQFWRRLFQDLEFRQRYIDRWTEFRRDEFRTSNINSILDNLASQVSEAQERNFERWPEVSPRGGGGSFGVLDGTHQGEVEHQKEWLRRRTDWMDGLFLAAPAFDSLGGVVQPGSSLSMTGPDGATLYYTLDGTDPRLPGGGISDSALEYTGTVELAESAVVTARSFDPTFNTPISSFNQQLDDNEAWSGVTSVSFEIGTLAAQSLRISEIHYHPADPSADEEEAGFNNATDFEFIELVNVGSETIDLSGAELREIMVDGQEHGVTFDFSTGDVIDLAPGGRVLVVEDVEAFDLRYGDGLPVAGQWSGSLSNAGEILTLVVDGATVHEFAYDDAWHETTDGDGPSLEIINPTSGDLESWSQARSWRASQPVGGTPGRVTFGDFDGDEQVGAEDIDQLFAQVHSLGPATNYDLTGDGRVDPSDVDHLVNDLLGSLYGDSDLDGNVDMDDLQVSFDNYTGSRGTDRGWALGNFDGDGDVDNEDLAKIFGHFTGPLVLESESSRTSNATTSSAGVSDAENVPLNSTRAASSTRVAASPASGRRAAGDAAPAVRQGNDRADGSSATDARDEAFTDLGEQKVAITL